MTLFKILFFVCFFTGSALAKTEHEIKKWFLQIAMECSKEHPVTNEEIQMLKDHKIPNDKNVKCLIACVFRKVEWLDSKGMFDPKSAYKMSEEKYANEQHKLDSAKKLYALCEKVNNVEVADGEEGCERSTLLAKCFIDNSAKMGFEIQ